MLQGDPICSHNQASAVQVIPGMTKPSRAKHPAWLLRLIFGYGLFLALLTILHRLGPDRWWLGAFNLYLPQVVWLVPVLLLTLLALVYARPWIWVLGVYCLWIGGPIMGFSWNFRGYSESGSRGSLVRVMTCNTKYGQRDISALFRDIDQYEPDIVLLQDVKIGMKSELATFFKEWNVRTSGQYLVASRLPFAKVEVIGLSLPGENDLGLRTVLRLGDTPITLYNVHLLTPRDGLNAFRPARKQPSLVVQAIQDLQDNVERRLIQARLLVDFVQRERGVVIVAGDLNSPDESLVCQNLRNANLHDAFAEGGRGYGYTYGHFLLRGRVPWLPGASWMRIDHILLSSQLRSQRCWTGTGAASDHRPVFADLIVTAP
jgi:vancomycin resistance protein VanJ